MIKVIQIDASKDQTMVGLKFIPFREDEKYYYLTYNHMYLKSDCTVLSDTQPEPTLSEKITSPINEHKGFCIKRTPENAVVLNKWANEFDRHKKVDWYDGESYYVCSKIIKFNQLTTLDYNIPEGFTELFTVEEFFAKVNYAPDSDSSKTGQGKIIVDTNQDVLDHIMKEERIPFNIGKFGTGKFNVETHIGAGVEILKIVNGMDSPIVGVVTGINDGEKVVRQWGIEGFEDKSGLPNGYSDLFLIPKTKTVWVNTYESQPFESELIAKIEGEYPKDLKLISRLQVIKPIE